MSLEKLVSAEENYIQALSIAKEAKAGRFINSAVLTMKITVHNWGFLAENAKSRFTVKNIVTLFGYQAFVGKFYYQINYMRNFMFKKIIPFMLIAFVTACAAEPQPAPVAEKAEQCKCVKNKDGSCRKCTKNGKKCQCPHAKKGDKAAKPSAKTEKPASTDGKTEAK